MCHRSVATAHYPRKLIQMKCTNGRRIDRHSREGWNPVALMQIAQQKLDPGTLTPNPSPASGRGEHRAAALAVKLAGMTIFEKLPSPVSDIKNHYLCLIAY